MASPVPLTPPLQHAEASFPDRLRNDTPYPHANSNSPSSRLTPKTKDIQNISTHSASSSLRISFSVYDVESELTKLEITSTEKAGSLFEAAVNDLDDAYLMRGKPNYQIVLLAQNLLYKVINYSKENWRLRAFCKIEMARVSPSPHFQRYWIEKGLNDLDVYSQTTCLSFKHGKSDLMEEVINCSATYFNISKLCNESLPDLAERALQKYEQCESYLQHLGRLVEVRPMPTESPSARTPEKLGAEGELETVTLENTTFEKVATIFQTAIRYLKEAYRDPKEPKFDLILLAQDHLYTVISHNDDDWRISVKSKIKMTRISSNPDFQQYWIKEALKNLDDFCEETCQSINPENKANCIDEIKVYSATYFRISKKWVEKFPELSERAFKKYEECKRYLEQETTDAGLPRTPAASPAQDPSTDRSESAPQQSDANPATPDKISAVNKTQTVFFLSVSVCLMGLAYAQRGRLQQLFRKISKIALIYILHPHRLRGLMTQISVQDRLLGNSTTGESGPTLD
ncbi:MAG: hypothetical protein JSS10_04310 [Verrucomicrobia bacterium]|nr:hypothetical protein [Verrucomicrobiota bacterium]